MGQTRGDQWDRINREIRRRTDVVGNSTTSGSKARRYLGLDVLTRSRMSLITGDPNEDTDTSMTTAALTV